jgi:signal peptidase I
MTANRADATDAVDTKARSPWSAIAELTGLGVVVILVAFLMHTFLFQAFRIPSGSMEPTLEVGDRVVVNKLSYRFHDVRRGDLVVFKAPESERSLIADFVKRVVALPGETIEWREEGGQYNVYIDGQFLEEPYLPEMARGHTVPFNSQPPPNCVRTTVEPHVSCTVPAGSVLVMGDNRTQSKDGRAFGPIPEDAIVGRVFIKIWPVPLRVWSLSAGWLQLAVLLAALTLTVIVARTIRRRRRTDQSEPRDTLSNPAPSEGRGQESSEARVSATINWTRSE